MDTVKPRLPATWVSDNSITNCTLCGTEFSILNRKHHCRSCGNIFCYYCCYQLQSLPSYIPSTHSRYCDGKRHKVCNSCLKNIVVVKQSKNLIFILSLLPLPLNTLVILRTVSTKWKIAVDTLISVFKSIHFKIGYQAWTNVERRLLKTHWTQFTGHSRLMVQALGALKGIVPVEQMIRHFHHNKQQTCCAHLFCDTNCAQSSHYDIVHLLQSFPSILHVQEVEAWVGQKISKIQKKWLALLLPSLLCTPTPSRPMQRLVANNVLPTVVDDKQLAFNFYFTCNAFVEDSPNASYYQALLHRFLHMTPFKDSILQSHKFLYNIQHPQNITNYDFDKICMPFDPTIIIRDVQVVNIKQLNTCTMPWIIPVDTYNHGTIQILLKHDDIRKDKFAMDVARMMQLTVPALHLQVYHVLPVNAKFGIVQMLPHTQTLQEIQKHTTLTNWIVQHNLNATILQIRETFIQSCASNCILTYVLGVGDRNLGNILLLQNGTMCNIDFSYLLGTDPRLQELTQMRITPGMVQLLGGPDSQHFTQLKQTCTTMFSTVKKFSFFWYAVFRYLALVNPPVQPHYQAYHDIQYHVETRLMPEASEEMVTMAIENIVQSNSDSHLAGLIDTFHTWKASV